MGDGGEFCEKSKGENIRKNKRGLLRKWGWKEVIGVKRGEKKGIIEKKEGGGGPGENGV